MSYKGKQVKPRNFYMERAIELAKRAHGKTHPNPIVGSILVDKNGEIKAEGYHKKAGTSHAEVECLKSFKKVDSEDILYVTLEPCCFVGKTPACTDLLLKKGVKQIIVGALDPNPKVSGKGVQILRDRGVQVSTGLLKKECEEINEFFNRYILKNLPFIAVKSAITLDGKIAMKSGESKWISNEKSRARGHSLRSQYQAIAIGKNTLVNDDPLLTDRFSSRPKNPKRILFSSKLDFDPELNFIQSEHSERFIITGKNANKNNFSKLHSKGIRIFQDLESDLPDVTDGLEYLFSEGVYSILIEGGGTLITSLLKQNLVDKIHLFISPTLIGQKSAASWVGELGLQSLDELPEFNIVNTKMNDNNIELTMTRY